MFKVVDDKRIRNMDIAYKDRECTDCLCVVFHPIECTPVEVYREQRTKCMFDLGVHYLVMPNGTVYLGVPSKGHADILYDHSDTGVYVMMVGCEDMKSMTDAQHHVLHALQEKLHIHTLLYEG